MLSSASLRSMFMASHLNVYGITPLCWMNHWHLLRHPPPPPPPIAQSDLYIHWIHSCSHLEVSTHPSGENCKFTQRTCCEGNRTTLIGFQVWLNTSNSQWAPPPPPLTPPTPCPLSNQPVILIININNFGIVQRRRRWCPTRGEQVGLPWQWPSRSPTWGSDKWMYDLTRLYPILTFRVNIFGVNK